jgi:iron-sulfur cluster assembly accessory protein
MLQLTDTAVKKVKQLIAAENKEGYGLRVGVQGGGCAGFQYALNFDNEQRENDQVLEFDGLKVYVDAMSNMYLDEVSIDYVDSIQGSGFKIDNPKATGSCGCGHSFSG